MQKPLRAVNSPTLFVRFLGVQSGLVRMGLPGANRDGGGTEANEANKGGKQRQCKKENEEWTPPCKLPAFSSELLSGGRDALHRDTKPIHPEPSPSPSPRPEGRGEGSWSGVVHPARIDKGGDKGSGTGAFGTRSDHGFLGLLCGVYGVHP